MKNNYKNIILIILTFLCFGAIWFFAYKKFKELTFTIKENYQSLYEDQKIKNNISDIRSSYQKIKPDIDSINSYFLTKDQEVVFIENLESFAKDNKLDVEISSINIEKDQVLAKNNLVYLVVKINIKGSWEGIYRFLNLVEMLPYHIFINKFSISKPEDLKNKILKGFLEVYIVEKN